MNKMMSIKGIIIIPFITSRYETITSKGPTMTAGRSYIYWEKYASVYSKIYKLSYMIDNNLLFLKFFIALNCLIVLV